MKCPTAVEGVDILASLPPRGAWIEIEQYMALQREIIVAPPAGSVD